MTLVDVGSRLISVRVSASPLELDLLIMVNILLVLIVSERLLSVGWVVLVRWMRRLWMDRSGVSTCGTPVC